ncbi:MAG TPA: hypothetical protein VFI96_00180, partial [Longimicrobiaceae bacterium]|nr:hypothetical protein [Longimicrobiaceae bacterium]
MATAACEKTSSDSAATPPPASPQAGETSQLDGLAALDTTRVKRTELWLALQASGQLAAVDAATGDVLHTVD